MDYVNPPIGKGKLVPGSLKPLIAIPTTAGTGSETTGVAIFDYEELNAKTGIASRALKPTLALIDPNNTASMPPEVAAASGFDVLCHSLESYTAIPYMLRTPRPTNPGNRPTYQGSNPISDVWSLTALTMLSKYFVRAVENTADKEARSNMLLASTYAGIGFGNSGVHLCHGMSYPVSSLVKKLKYQPTNYDVGHSLLPHGYSVVLHAPAVFRFTGIACPDRHIKAAEIMGADIKKATNETAGNLLAEQIIKMMKRLKIPRGLSAVGVKKSDISQLVQGTLPQHRVTKLSPRVAAEKELTKLFEESMEIW